AGGPWGGDGIGPGRDHHRRPSPTGDRHTNRAGPDQGSLDHRARPWTRRIRRNATGRGSAQVFGLGAGSARGLCGFAGARGREALPIVAPVSGFVTEKSIVHGSAFMAGQVLYRIAPLDPAWIIASIYQVDLPLVRIGLPVRLMNPYLDERSRHGRVSFIAPSL